LTIELHHRRVESARKAFRAAKMGCMAGVLIGGLLSGLFVLVGIGVTASNEHRRWLRDQRYTTWRELLALSDEVMLLPLPSDEDDGPEETLDRPEATLDRLEDVQRRLEDVERRQAAAQRSLDASRDRERLMVALHGLLPPLALVGPPSITRKATELIKALRACLANDLSRSEMDALVLAAGIAYVAFGCEASVYLWHPRLREPRKPAFFSATAEDGAGGAARRPGEAGAT